MNPNLAALERATSLARETPHTVDQVIRFSQQSIEAGLDDHQARLFLQICQGDLWLAERVMERRIR